MQLKNCTLILILILFFSCTKKNDDNSSEPGPSSRDTTCLLNNYVGVKNGTILISEYKYDEKKRIREEVINISINDLQYNRRLYSYDDQGRRIKLTTESYARDDTKDPFKLIQTIHRDYEYDANGRFVKATDSYGSKPVLQAEYNDKGQLFKITGNVEASNYLLLTYDDHGDVVKIERISQTNPAIRITQAQFEYDTSRPARILPEQLEVLHGLDFLVQKHLCKRAYYSTDAEGKPLVQVDFKVYKRTDAGKPEWEWVDVQWNNNPVRTYSLEYQCK